MSEIEPTSNQMDQQPVIPENENEVSQPMRHVSLDQLVSNSTHVTERTPHQIVDGFFNIAEQMNEAIINNQPLNFELSKQYVVGNLDIYDKWLQGSSWRALFYRTQMKLDGHLKLQYNTLMSYKNRLKEDEG